MRFGVSSYAFGWNVGFAGAVPERPMDELDLLAFARDAGADAVQIADNLPLDTFDTARLERLRRAADEAGLLVEVGFRRLTAERLSRGAEIARFFGSPFMRFVIDDRDYHPSLPEIEAMLRENLAELGGVTLAIENHDRFRAAELRELVERVGSPQVAICLDTANSVGAGEGLETVLRELGPLAVNVHLKDVAFARIETLQGFTVSGRPAGRGQIDFPELLESLGRSGRCESATVELWTPAEPTHAQTLEKERRWASESCEYLRPLVKR